MWYGVRLLAIICVLLGVHACSDDSTPTFILSPQPAGNSPPSFTSSASVMASENEDGVIYTATVTDADGDTITYSIVDAGDGTFFVIDSATGELRFVVAPSFEFPEDVNKDNVYDVTVQASDGTDSVTIQVSVTVEDVIEEFTITKVVGLNAMNAECCDIFGLNPYWAATVDDTDADGTPDIGISDTDQGRGDKTGQAFIFSGKAITDAPNGAIDVTQTQLPGRALRFYTDVTGGASRFLGHTISSAGDYNNDGFGDYFMVTRSGLNEFALGFLYLFSGASFNAMRADPIDFESVVFADGIGVAFEPSAFYGSATIDFDGDGVSDLHFLWKGDNRCTERCDRRYTDTITGSCTAFLHRCYGRRQPVSWPHNIFGR